MRQHLPAMTSAFFEDSMLAQAGVIDAIEFRRGVTEYARGMQNNFAVGLYFTLQTELWLRSHFSDGTTSALMQAQSKG
jgi:hypothetical protein